MILLAICYIVGKLQLNKQYITLDNSYKLLYTVIIQRRDGKE